MSTFCILIFSMDSCTRWQTPTRFCGTDHIREPFVLFINHATDTRAAKNYFTEHLSRSDYYLRDSQEIAGRWHGRGAELLGLSGAVDQKKLFPALRKSESAHRRTAQTSHQSGAPRPLRLHLRCAQIREPRL